MKTSTTPLIKIRLRLCVWLGWLLCCGTGLSWAAKTPPGPSAKLEIVLPGQTTPASDPGIVAWGDYSHGQTLVPTSVSGVLAIAAGEYHTVALRADGIVVGWGLNSDGQASAPFELKDVVAIAAGKLHTVALKQDGTVADWGWPGIMQGMANGYSGVVAISAGDAHSVALMQDGTVGAWGSNNFGQCTAPEGLNNVVAIAAGGSHTVALKANGTVVAWGSNGSGQSSVPAGLNGVAAIATGGAHTVVLKQDGTVIAWGDNTFGQARVPSLLSNVVAISAGMNRTVAVKQDGTVVAWGDGAGRLSTMPAGLTGVGAIAAGGHHTVALTRAVEFGIATRPAFIERSFKFTSSGAIDADSITATLIGTDAVSFTIVGDPLPSNLAVGSSTNLIIRFSPQHVGKHSAILRITSNDPALGRYDVALTGTGAPPAAPKLEVRDSINQVISGPTPGNKVVAWGLKNAGFNYDAPKGLTDVVAVAAGYTHAAALKQDGTVVAWGVNYYGETDVPKGLTGVTAIAAGSHHTVALKQDGSIVGWGHFFVTPDGTPAGMSGVAAVSAGDNFTVALKQDGTVVAWGDNLYGQCNVPKGLTGVIAIASSRYRTMALKQDGSVVGWGSNVPVGNNSYGPPYVPSPMNGLTSIALAFDRTIGLKQDGSVVAWGLSRDDSTFVPQGLSNAVAVAAGDLQSLALKDDGTVIGWRSGIPVPQSLSGVQAIAAGSFHALAVVEGPGDFGARHLNTQRTHRLNLANTGTLALELSASIDGPDADQFRLVNDVPGTLAVNGTSELSYQFIPTRVGPLHATLKFTSNALETPVYTLDLTGSGIYTSNPATKPGVTGSNLIYGPPVADRTTGAIIQKITFANTTGLALNGLRLVISRLPPGVTVQSSSATGQPGTVQVIYSKPIAKDETVSLTLTYNDPLRRANMLPLIHAENLADPEPRDGPVEGVLVPLQSIRDSANGPVLQWNTTPRKTYVVEYSDDNGKTWYSAVHRLVAGGPILFWTDRGQPETWSKPTSKATRSYRVKRIK